MHVIQQTTEWKNARVIDGQTAQAILAYESQKKKPFWILGLLWLGLLCSALGIISLITEHWESIPAFIKLTSAFVGLGGAVFLSFYWVKRERHLLAEMGLLIAFLMVGVCIGLVAQVFNLPLETPQGLLLWAALSVILVLLSHRPVLSHMWIPLFLGGILGYVKLEFLLLFFAQMPFLTTALVSTVLLGLILLSDHLPTPFMRGVYHWSIALYYVVLYLGDISMQDSWLGFLVAGGFLGLLAIYALYAQKIRVFNLTLFLLTCRFMMLYFQVFDGWTGAGLTLLPLGVVLSAVSYALYNRQKHR